MKVFHVNILTLSLSGLALLANVFGDAPKKKEDSPDLFQRLLGEQISSERADYREAKLEWKPIIEARVRGLIFTYWVHTSKFGVPRSSMIELRFGELLIDIKKAGSFSQTFENPCFISTSNEFPRHSYTSESGKRFQINNIDEFRKANEEFLVFLASCEATVKRREHSRQVEPRRDD